MPHFAEYRQKGYDRDAQAALRTIATAEEAYFIENDEYLSCNQGNCHLLLTGVDPANAGIILSIVATSDSFTGTATHIRGTGEVFSWSH